MLVLAAVSAWAGAPALLPWPRQYRQTGGAFAMGRVRLQAEACRADWEAFVGEAGGTIDDKAARAIEVALVPSIPEAEGNEAEAYRLTVTARRIRVEAVTEQGAYWALQTLRQLEREDGRRAAFRCCEVTDWPAFRVRGFLQDVGRTYVSMDELKREVERLSRFKMNVFHWHLTENQAWRLESRVFPALNDSANMTRMPGRYYTLDQARELADFCKRHHVLLIPELDMPGHSAAFERTFRHDMQSPEGMKILKLLVEEACEALDVPYLHIGTDEVPFTNPAFVPEMVAFVRSLGKKVISWNPGWHYEPGEVDMTHLWSYRGKAQPGIPAIDSRFHYLNHFDTFADLVGLYTSRVYGQPEGSDDLAGSIVAVWNDRLVDSERNIVIENGLYPHALALAERTWRGGGWQYFDGNGTMLPADSTEAYREFADFERRLLWHKDHTLAGCPVGYVKQTHVRWHITDAFPNGGDLSKAFPPEENLADSYEYEGKTYGVRAARGAGIYLRHVWGATVPAFYPEPEEDHTAYAYTWVYSPREQEVGLMAEFQNYSRSEMDLPPRPGEWDYKGSRVWVNDREVAPPVWTATHRVKSNETALGNENAVARPPLPVRLEKGWNKVLLKLPVGKFKMEETRLVKWMFAAVFVTPDGAHAADLVYSPEKQR